MPSFQMRCIPAANKFQLGRPTGGVPTHKLQGVDEAGPILGTGCRRAELTQCINRLIRFAYSIQDSPGGRRPNSGQELDNTKPGYLITQVLRPAQEREDILDMRRLRNLRPPYFTNGILRRVN